MNQFSHIKYKELNESFAFLSNIFIKVYSVKVGVQGVLNHKVRPFNFELRKKLDFLK